MRAGYVRSVRAGAIGSVTSALFLCAVVGAAPAPTTGVLEVSARIESGCRIVGQPATSGVDFGELNFGTYPSLFNQPLIAQAQAPSSTLQLRCVGVSSAQVTIGAGMNSLGNQRRLESAGQYVPYDLFADAAASQPFSVNTARSVSIAGTAPVELTVFGRVLPTLGGYAPGIYQDQVQVTVSW
jgi:spore coat protein U-like protein